MLSLVVGRILELKIKPSTLVTLSSYRDNIHQQCKVIACWSPFLSSLVVIKTMQIEVKPCLSYELVLMAPSSPAPSYAR